MSPFADIGTPWHETRQALARRVALIAHAEGFAAGARAQREMEPTPEMIQAWHDRMIEGADYIDRNSIEYALYVESYHAMQRAAPLVCGEG